METEESKEKIQETTKQTVSSQVVDLDSLCGIIETVIFMSDRPISLSKIKQLVDLQITDEILLQAMDRLKNEYEKKYHGIFIREVAGGYQFSSRQKYSDYVKRFFKATSFVLSPSALEVLAIIAYRQPISRVEVDRIRSVDSSHLVRGLIDKKLIRMVGRADEAGRPLLFGTTNEFLEVFSLKSLKDLPPEQEMIDLAKEDLGNISDIQDVMASSDKNNFTYEEIQELDKLKGEIKSVNVDTDFTRDLQNEERKRRNVNSSVVGGNEKKDGEISSRSAFDIMEDHLKKTGSISEQLPEKSPLPEEDNTKKEVEELEKKEMVMENLQDDIVDKAQDLQMDLDFKKDKPDDS
ncbi:MAG: SMC-Scp complex subunit ScpB [Halobacteriovoraceae bacterium]|nr:SMC-Scp complex subunit ScpB [Halobacteriovoraceae bacterium]